MSRFFYGGQAVIEGVMMRGRTQATVAVRAPDGEIVLRTDPLPRAAQASGWVRVPLLRGLVALWDTTVLGMRMMLFSANVQARAELGSDIPPRLMRTMLALSATFAVFVFFVLPLLAAPAGSGGGRGLQGNLVEGALRLLLFLGYLFLIGRLSRVRRLFEYHGAEHKTINAFEAGAPLTPGSVQRFSREHPRCGTAFLLWVVVLSIVVFTLIGHPPLLLGILSRVVLIPVIAAFSYELLRAGARYYRVALVRAIVRPGLWLQRLTTREPDDQQVETAIAALLPVLRADGVRVAGEEPSAPEPVQVLT